MSLPKDIISSVGLVLRDVVAERLRQDQKWGSQNHKQMIWLGILAEEFGEAAQAVNELHFRPGEDAAGMLGPETALKFSIQAQRKHLREELVQTAAVAVAMIESLDRNGR